ncbi:MAG: AhpC/TSA family protein [Marinilabiliaceae bacterium]|nr:AhpC/TSA family protein [Marinilabiliaceae bacterium]
MRKLFFSILIISVSLLSSCSSNEYKITGQFENDLTGQVTLKRLTLEGLEPVDTVRLIDGMFTFTGSVDIPEMYMIDIDNIQEPIFLFVENRKITITGNTKNLQDIVVKGSKLNDIFYGIKKDIPHQEKMQELESSFIMAQKFGDEAAMRSIIADSEVLIEDIKNYYLKCIRTNYANPIGAFLVLEASQMMSMDEFEEVILGLKENLSDHPYTIGLNEFLESMKFRQQMMEQMQMAMSMLEPGNEAPNFILTDIKGKEVDLKSFRGKYVFIDFWASWCRPCRMENPNLVKVYKIYGGKNFEIISISLDETPEEWKKGVADDGLTWTQLYDATGEVAEKYGVETIPNTWLLDKEGVILKKDLRGEELIEYLKSIL